MSKWKSASNSARSRPSRPGGKGADCSLSWFGLTDGIYCIDTPAGRLFEHSLPADPDVGEPWCDYQVARLFEDLIEIWHAVADPVPEDILARYLLLGARARQS
ncbi:MAG: DUF5984 family protein [Aliidongia sp.]